MAGMGFFTKVLNGAAAADATGIGAMPPSFSAMFVECTVYVVFGAGTGAGTVLLESSHDATYAGTWATEATISWAAASAVKVAHLTAVNKALRVRISSAVTGGTCDVYMLFVPVG